MNTPLAVADHVSKVFRAGSQGVVAVRDVSCTIVPQARVALFGPSGSGKSTLLQLLAGLDPPTVGSITWPAFGGDDLRPSHVAFAFQNQTLLPALTVLENVEVPLLLQGVPSREASSLASDALDRLELGDLSTKLPEELSGGQAQRAGFARALAGRPQLLLADEPTGQLDQVTARAFFQAVLPWLDEMRCALVIATHDASVAGLMQEHWSMRFGILETRV